MATIVQLWNDVACASGAKQIFNVVDYISIDWTEQVGGNRGGCTLVLRANDSACAKAAIFNVIRIIDDLEDGSAPTIYEYRISELNDAAQLSTVTVTGMDIALDLGRNRMRQILGGVAIYAQGSLPMTTTQIINGFVLPALADAGMPWFSLGTITPTDAYALSWNRITPLALMQQLEQTTHQDFWVSRNGDVGYLINLGLRNDGGAVTPLVEVGSNVVALARQIIANELFYNRCTPMGNAISGESVPTHLGQHGWKHTTMAGNVLTLANPIAGMNAPIGFDTQLDTLVAMLPHDGMPFQHAKIIHSAVGYDTTNARVGVATESDTFVGANLSNGVIQTVDVATGQQRTSAIVADGTASEVFAFPASGAPLIWSPNTAEWVVPIVDSAGTHIKVKFVSAAGVVNATVVTVSATTTTPTLFRYVPALDRIFICVDTTVTVINPNTHAIDGTIATSSHISDMVRSASASKVYFLEAGQTTIYKANDTSPFGGVATFSASASDIQINNLLAVSGTTLYCMTRQSGGAFGYRSYDTTGAAWSGTFFLPGNYKGAAVGVGTSAGTDVLQHGFIPVITSMGFCLLNAANPTTDLTVPPLPLTGGAIYYPTYNATLDAWLHLSPSQTMQAHFWNNGVPKPWQSFPVSATLASAQTITKPAANVGFYATGACVEFRADTNETYIENLTNPASLAVYGPVDGFPTFDLTAKRNYKRDGFLSEWDANNEPRWVAVSDPCLFRGATITPAPITRGYRWQSADQAGATSYACVKDTTETFSTVGLTTLNFKSLPAGLVLQPGDCFYVNASQMAFVRTRTVVSGSGTATVPVNVTEQTWVDLTATTLYTPRLTINGLPALGANALVMTTQSPTASGAAPVLRFTTPIPSIVGASLAWVVAKFAFYSYDSAGIDPVGVTLKSPGAPSAQPSIATNLAVHAPIVGPVTVPQTFSLAAVMTLNENGTQNGDPQYWSFEIDGPVGKYACYLLSLEVLVATAITDLVPFDLVDGSQSNTMWTLTNTLLALKGNPTVNYKVTFIERVDAKRVHIGQSLRLKDVARGINTLTARAVALQRFGVKRGALARSPVVTLNNQNQYIATELVALETA